MVLPLQASALKIWQSTRVSEINKTITTRTLKIFPFCKWQMVAKLLSLKKIQTKPEVLLSKCGEWDLVRLFEEWLVRRHRLIENSGPL